MKQNNSLEYGSVAKFYHWLIFFLVAFLIATGLTVEAISKDSLRFLTFNVHELTGLTVCFLMVLRTIWTIRNIRPELPPTVKTWEKSTAHILHSLLYIILFIMPVSGFIMATSGGHPVNFFGFQLWMPFISHNSETLNHQAFNLHHYVGYTLIACLAIHILAALKHHIIKKDATLRRMLPNN